MAGFVDHLRGRARIALGHLIKHVPLQRGQHVISGGSEILPCDLTPLKQLGFLCLHAGRCAIPKLYGLPHLSYLLLSTIDSLEPLRFRVVSGHLQIGRPRAADLGVSFFTHVQPGKEMDAAGEGPADGVGDV